jgi:hypothetical protein
LLALAQIVVNKLSPILVTIALLSFFWLVIKFIRNSDNPSEQAKTKSGILYAILALFVLVSIWGKMVLQSLPRIRGSEEGTRERRLQRSRPELSALSQLQKIYAPRSAPNKIVRTTKFRFVGIIVDFTSAREMQGHAQSYLHRPHCFPDWLFQQDRSGTLWRQWR